jgi:hypothetical protein
VSLPHAGARGSARVRGIASTTTVSQARSSTPSTAGPGGVQLGDVGLKLAPRRSLVGDHDHIFGALTTCSSRSAGGGA